LNDPSYRYTVADIPVLLATIDSLKQTIAEQQQTITALQTEIVQLKARLAELEARLNQNSTNSNRPPSSDGFRRPQTPRKKGGKPPGGQPGHPGHTLEQVADPDEITVHRVTTCSGCGASLASEETTSVERRQVHDLPPLKILVTEHRVESKRCPHCGMVTHATFPEDVKYPVQYGPNLKALMVYLSIYQLLPYDRVRELFSDLFNCCPSTGTMVNAVAECSRGLVGVEEQVRTLLKDAEVLHVDETGMRVNGKRHWLHVACTDLLTLYRYHRTRGSSAIEAMHVLPEFEGTVVHDFWSPYFRYPCRHAICNAHLQRELQGITENFRYTWSESLHALLDEIRKTVETSRGRHMSSLSLEQQTAFHERYRLILEAGQVEVGESTPAVPSTTGKRGRKKQSRAKNLLDRCQRYQNEILRFMRDFTVPFTNNQAERDLRMAKVQQKISGTFRSEEGASDSCRVRGYIATVKKQNQSILAALAGAVRGTPFVPTSVRLPG